MSILLGGGNPSPLVQYHLDQRPASLPKLKITAHCKSRYASGGRTEGLPPGAYGCGEPAESTAIDPARPEIRTDLGMGKLTRKNT
jgi:hypothetical protein